ncbi:MAG: AMP-binding protein [Roseovarius sp.]|nr:AMP-binding protein [Roseovarius sp.]MCY4314614.1 AMP-binding protein [Roseovarius sp.]
MLQHLGQAASIAAKNYANKNALIFNRKTLTFKQLHERIERAAAGLASVGVAPGDIVTLYAGNSTEWVISYYAIARAGAVINPINTMLTPEEVEFVVRDCGAKAIIVSESLVEGALRVRELVKAAVVVGDAAPDDMMTFKALLAGEFPDLPEIDVDPDSLSTICYTSGTTGHPKGAMQSHKSVIMNGAMTAQAHMRRLDDVVISALPCPHVYANVVMQAMMFYGATLVLHERFDPAALLADIPRHKATIIDGVPTMYMYMLDHPDLEKTDLSSLTRAYVGGQTMPEAKMIAVEEKFGIPLIELWGMTEIAGLGTTHPLYGINKHGSVGIALPYCEVRITDPDDPETALPVAEVGELQIRGPLNMMGYYGNEDQTRATLLADGWLRTGDMARLDEDGCVFIVDRLKDMILTGGFNVYPAEIERVLAGHPDVALAAVGKKADELKGEIAKAYIVLAKGRSGNAQAIMEYCRGHLAAYKCPREIQFVPDVPKTSTGKIMRRELHTLDAGN